MVCSKEGLYQALTILKKECSSQPNCFNCPLGNDDGECILQHRPPEKYAIHNPEGKTYRAFD